MIPKECKRLAEVDFPLAEVSRHAAREKSIRHGHPSTLHLWWARRPLASCRAVLLGLLWPDPCDPHCPPDFKAKARELLPKVPGCNPGTGDEQLRRALLRFIGDFAYWDLSANPLYLEVARGLVRAAYPAEPPLVVDPFAGGGSIPLEALRLGCETFASDLNPVAGLILKVLLEEIPRHGPQLAEELRRVGAEIREAAEKELADLYPKDPDGSVPIAYLWARTVRCEAPKCGAEIPLMRSFWLAKKASRKRALRYRIVRAEGGPPTVEFELFEPNSDNAVPTGTVTRAKATCPACGAVLPPERVRVQLAAQRGGADVVFDAAGNRVGGARMLAVVTVRPGEQGRHYRLPTERDYQAVRLSRQRLETILRHCEYEGSRGVSPVPDEPLPPLGTLGFRVQRYGMVQWGDLFTARQKVALATLARMVRELPPSVLEPALLAIGIVVNRCADYNSANCRWVARGEYIGNTLARQALPFVWDFAEVNAFSDAAGGYQSALEWVATVVEAWPSSAVGSVQIADATEHPLPDDTAHIWFTDPPYYDAVPYADLSDFFFVWMKRTVPRHPCSRDPFDVSNSLTPKKQEAVQDETKRDNGQSKDRRWFEETMARAFAEGRRVLGHKGLGSVIFAHKTTEGWEALLSGLIRGGWTITGSWPIATEMGSRLRARESAALATSVHLICRPRPEDAPVGDWADVLRELPKRVGEWMERLQGEGIRGADLVFACIGPALEIFSRYSKVETAEGREVQLAEYLERVWEVVGRIALENVLGTAEAQARNGAAGALEEDARLTALFLWTLQTSSGEAGADKEARDTEDEGLTDEDEEEGAAQGQAKGYSLIFDVVRRFAQPLGVNLPRWERRLIETKKGVVRLLSIKERARVLFGHEDSEAVVQQIETTLLKNGTNQLLLFGDHGEAEATRTRRRAARRPTHSIPGESLEARIEMTTLDRVHLAMLLQASGQAGALRALLQAEKERGPDFLRLANALSALYPKGSEEKRLLDAMLLAVPR